MDETGPRFGGAGKTTLKRGLEHTGADAALPRGSEDDLPGAGEAPKGARVWER